ncbi:Piso0_005191 [Millerozyma farinosa CBS 7064]|uniref:Piso0_005191 protein n=1 Tax=Pichia sorbitophila (strain ATCC MYA-4447 / BCRC 22081 / CBS 7064 / NBRC 10061 / NRRL Y-12695) TaxID=559304 RepID=G8Y1I4_PICSO|nr:Piso0_005191 [Millerozyma farinosa CBS 7064]
MATEPVVAHRGVQPFERTDSQMARYPQRADHRAQRQYQWGPSPHTRATEGPAEAGSHRGRSRLGDQSVSCWPCSAKKYEEKSPTKSPGCSIALKSERRLSEVASRLAAVAEPVEKLGTKAAYSVQSAWRSAAGSATASRSCAPWCPRVACAARPADMYVRRSNWPGASAPLTGR